MATSMHVCRVILADGAPARADPPPDCYVHRGGPTPSQLHETV